MPGAAGLQLKLLDVFYIPGVLFIFLFYSHSSPVIQIVLSPQENSKRIFCSFEMYNVKTSALLTY